LSLNTRADALAKSLSLSLQEWEEDGLGPARGCFVKLSSGKVVLIRELEHAVRHHGAGGPTVMVNVGDAANFGLIELVTEVKADLNLSPEQIAWMPPDADAWKAEARKLLKLSG
jgi:hypothetical protein